MTTVSVTELQSWRRCRRKWGYSSKNGQNLTGIGSGPEQLELGSLIHRALADWIADEDSELRDNPLRLATLFVINAAQRQQEVTAAYMMATGSKITPPFLATLHNVVELGAAMMQNYQDFHKTPYPKNMRFAMPEQEVLIPVPGTEHQCVSCYNAMVKDEITTVIHSMKRGPIVLRTGCKECGGTGTAFHYLSATLDGLLQDDKEWLYVLEHKTYENRPSPMSLYMNDQFTGYCWVVRQLKIGKVAGVAYDGMWKRPVPPKYMQKEKRPGVLDDLFIRKTITKSDMELDQWGENLTHQILEIASNPPLYPNVPWQGCSDCSFQEICYATMLGEEPSHLLKRNYITREDIIRGGKAVS